MIGASRDNNEFRETLQTPLIYRSNPIGVLNYAGNWISPRGCSWPLKSSSRWELDTGQLGPPNVGIMLHCASGRC